LRFIWRSLPVNVAPRFSTMPQHYASAARRSVMGLAMASLCCKFR